MKLRCSPSHPSALRFSCLYSALASSCWKPSPLYLLHYIRRRVGASLSSHWCLVRCERSTGGFQAWLKIASASVSKKKQPPLHKMQSRNQTKSFSRLLNFVNSVQLKNWEAPWKTNQHTQVQNLKCIHKRNFSLHRMEMHFSLRPRGRRCVRHSAPWTDSWPHDSPAPENIRYNRN